MWPSRRIVLVRHAAVLQSSPFNGHTDVEPCVDAIDILLPDLARYQPDLVLSSPLKRCRVLAESWIKTYQNPSVKPIRIQYWDALKERNWGAWDGLSPNQIEKNELEAYYQRPFDYPISQAETLAAMQQRIHQVWLKLLAEPSQTILCITHGGVMRILMQQLFKLPNEALFQLRFDYGSQLVLEVTATDSTPFVQLIEIRQGT